MKTYHVYVLPPVDIGWGLFKTVSQVIDMICDAVKQKAKDDVARAVDPGHLWEVDLNDFVVAYYQSVRAVESTGWWEGDMRHEAVVVPLVREVEGEYGFMWKQDNNGTTFVVTPEPIPQYDKFAVEYRAVSAQ
jgi:hypothetical protein